MKAVLAGSAGVDRLYYIIDAGTGEKDGVIVRPDGTSVRVFFFSFSAKALSVKKNRSSRFLRFLWDAPKNPTAGSWFETFIAKTKPISKQMLDGVNVVSQIGTNSKKLKTKSDKIESFLKSKTINNQVQIGCCGGMVKSDRENYSFKSLQQRQDAWIAMNLLRHIEDEENAK